MKTRNSYSHPSRVGVAVALLTVSCLLAPATFASEESSSDWPQWRGPERTGLALDASLPEKLPTELQKLWQVEVGTGHSSPVVVGDRVYLHSREGDNEVVRALDLSSGAELWRYQVETPYTRNPAAFSHGKGPKSTPVVAGDTLCTLGITGRLTCFDRANGKVRWQKDFAGRFDRAWPDFGTAMSPAVFDGKLIVQVGGIDSGALAAFDPRTGEQLWSYEGEGPAYASPVLIESHGKKQVVSQTRTHIVSVDLDTGNLLWQTELITAYEQNSITPVAYGDQIVVSGLDRGVYLLDVAPDARGNWLVREVFRNDDLAMYMSSPVISGSLLFGLTHKRKGQLFCLDLEAGAVRWTTEGRDGENAALILAGDRLLVLTTDAKLIVAKANAEGLAAEATYEVADSATWAHPALVGNRILIKDEDRLTAWSF
jgi:outer membrane protein assembly factor BamB